MGKSLVVGSAGLKRRSNSLGGTLQPHLDREIEHPPLVASGWPLGTGGDFQQFRLRQRRRLGAEVAQELGHSLLLLSGTGQLNGLPFLLEGLEHHTFGQQAPHFLQQVHRQIAVRLQIFHRALAGFEGCDVGL